MALNLRQLRNTSTSKIVNKKANFGVRKCQKTIIEMHVDPSTSVKALKYFIEHKDWCNVFGFMTINERIICSFLISSLMFVSYCGRLYHIFVSCCGRFYESWDV